MRIRCSKKYDIGYRYYGAKGIRVCPEWEDFAVFREWAMSHGYRDDLTIERINPRGNYEPSNCEWITRSENTRRGNALRKVKV